MADPLAKLKAKKEPWRRFQSTPLQRSCGSCTMCCVHLDIPVLDKPAGLACSMLSDAHQGCSIWTTRPDECRRYFCLWLAADAVVPPMFKPEICGFILTAPQLSSWPVTITVAPDAQRPDAWSQSPYVDLLHRMTREWNCVTAVAGPDRRIVAAFTPSRLYRRQTNPFVFSETAFEAPIADFGPDRRQPGEIMRDKQGWWERPEPG